MIFRNLAAALLFTVANAQAVILFRTGDTSANTSAPTGDLAGSGWQYEGIWGGFLGTPIAPHYFISALHIGNQGNFMFDGVTYAVVAEFADPESDLHILQVAETFPSFAPLYSGREETGKRIAEFGRGTQRGAAIILNGVLKGWGWGAGDGVMRWGENTVTGVYPFGPNSDLLFANFDGNGLPNECHLSVGDSGGAAFIQDTGIWKLAGINYAVDGPFYTDAQGNGGFFAALFDARGFFSHDTGTFVEITGPGPVPTALYPTRISTRLAWIAEVIAAPVLARDANVVSFTFTKLTVPATDLIYTVEQSSDLAVWTPTAIPLEIVSTNRSVQTVKVSVNAASSPALFLRLRITRP